MSKIYTYDDFTNIQRFINNLKKQARASNINLKLDPIKAVDFGDGHMGSGFFQPPVGRGKGELATATYKNLNDWLSILVHESCHLDQWKEGVKVWKDCDNLKYNIFDDWLLDKKCNIKIAHECIDKLRELELDCEKRSVEKIKKYKLPIDLNTYIRKANAYVFFYNYIKITRRWSDPKNTPYNNPKIYKKLKNSWYENYDEIPPEIMKLYRKYKI